MNYKALFFGIVTAGVICSCDMNKNKDNTVNMSDATDNAMMTKTDTGSGTVNASSDKMSIQAKPDSGDDLKNTSTAKPDPSKKGKKGKVSVDMTDTKGTGDMSMDKDGYYASTEVLPGFPGGQKALGNFFEKNIQYPQEATDNGAEGTVKINFAVDEKGKVYAPKTLNDKIGYGIEKEALRVFAKMPAWTPGKIKGRNVKTRFTLPVTFQLN
jgi:periplasmic protein TonB